MDPAVLSGDCGDRALSPLEDVGPGGGIVSTSVVLEGAVTKYEFNLICETKFLDTVMYGLYNQNGLRGCWEGEPERKFGSQNRSRLITPYRYEALTVTSGSFLSPGSLGTNYF